EQLELLEASLRAIGPHPSQLRARLLATLAAELVYSPRSEERFATADEALRIAREIGDPMTLFDVLFRRAPVARRPTRAEVAGETARARALGAEKGNRPPGRTAGVRPPALHNPLRAGRVERSASDVRAPRPPRPPPLQLARRPRAGPGRARSHRRGARRRRATD